MKLFLQRLVLFLLIFTVVNASIGAALPFWWGNYEYAEKINYLKENIDNYNTVFIGSSRVYRQLDPKIFDSILKDKNIHSFNLGSAGAYNPETYKLIEKLIQQEWFRPKLIIMEIQELNKIPNQNLHKNRIKYFFDVNTFIYSALYLIYDSQYSFTERLKIFAKYFISFLENIFNFGLSSNIQRLVKTPACFGQFTHLEFVGKNGYLPLEKWLSNIDSEDMKKKLINRQKQYHCHPLFAYERLEMIEDYYRSSVKYSAHPIHLSKLLSIQQMCEKKDIKVLFV